MKKSEEYKLELEQLYKDEKEFANKIRERFGDHWWKGGEAEKAYWNEGGRYFMEREKELKYLGRKETNRELEVGDGCTYYLWSDSYACTVIKKTAKTITIQRDKATLDPSFKPEWVAGGFAAHCTNAEDQSYTYERNPNGEIYVCHWSEKEGRYRTGSDGSIKIGVGRHEYYDYNF